MQHLLWMIPALTLSGCAGLRHDAGPVDARREQILAECQYAAAQGRAAAAGAAGAQDRLEQTMAGTDVFVACLDAKGY